VKTRTLQTKADIERARADLLGLEGHLPIVLTLTKGKRIRTEAQNARYWATLTQHLENISNWVQQIADETGHTTWEIRQLIARDIEPQYAPIVYCFMPEAAHKVLKIICDVPTTTRMGTKEFMAHEARMEQTMAEVVGSIQQVAMTMGAIA